MNKSPFFKTRISTMVWLYFAGVKNYRIRKDLTIDVDGNVDISCLNLKRIPVQFGMVNGYFNCGNNRLTSLNGSPVNCTGWFSCSRNRLTSLDGGPKTCTEFCCSHNQLTNLDGGLEACDGFHCDNNQITSLKGAPRECLDFCCYSNHLADLDGGTERMRTA